jgi:hypothetical protein
MPETAKITCAEWRQYLRRMVRLARSEIKPPIFIRGAISAIVTGAIGFWAAYLAGFGEKKETPYRFLIVVGAAIVGPALTCGGEFLFRFPC